MWWWRERCCLARAPSWRTRSGGGTGQFDEVDRQEHVCHIGKMVKGETPYDKAAVDAAITQIQAELPKIPDDLSGRPEGRRQLNGITAPRRRSGRTRPISIPRCRSFEKTDGRRQGIDQGSRQPQGRRSDDDATLQRLPRDLSGQAEVIPACNGSNIGKGGRLAAIRPSYFIVRASRPAGSCAAVTTDSSGSCARRS